MLWPNIKKIARWKEWYTEVEWIDILHKTIDFFLSKNKDDRCP